MPLVLLGLGLAAPVASASTVVLERLAFAKPYGEGWGALYQRSSTTAETRAGPGLLTIVKLAKVIRHPRP